MEAGGRKVNNYPDGTNQTTFDRAWNELGNPTDEPQDELEGEDPEEGMELCE